MQYIMVSSLPQCILNLHGKTEYNLQGKHDLMSKSITSSGTRGGNESGRGG